MTEEQQRAIQMLVDGLAHFDAYRPRLSDDEAVYVVRGNCEYEFASADDDLLRVGHLRDIPSIFTQES